MFRALTSAAHQTQNLAGRLFQNAGTRLEGKVPSNIATPQAGDWFEDFEALLRNLIEEKFQLADFSSKEREAQGRLPDRVEIVAEIGVNHDGSIDKAKKLVSAAKSAGADYVKFQSFSPRLLALRSTPKVTYQLQRDLGDSHFEMLSRLALSDKDQVKIHNFCLSEEIGFFSTPYDPSQVKFLAGLEVPYLKVASADIVDVPLLEAIANTGISPILSTGMASKEEITRALDLLKASTEMVTILHAISMYPAPSQSLRLDSISRLRSQTGARVGFSDHSEGYLAGPVAAALGAVMVEKHFTLDREDVGPDHAASADPETFSKMVDSIREVEKMSGYVSEELSEVELEMKNVSRKSLVSAVDLPEGTLLEKDHLVALRPGNGIPVSDFYQWIGRTLRRNVPALTQLSPEDFC